MIRLSCREGWPYLQAEVDLSHVEEEPHTQGYIEPTREASPPPEDFDMRNTDMILRSSDGASFRVHRLVLTTASPFFDDIFSLLIDGIHVIRLSEDKEVLHSLITMLYPIPSVLPQSGSRDSRAGASIIPVSEFREWALHCGQICSLQSPMWSNGAQ
jgi:hypothetical protein